MSRDRQLETSGRASGLALPLLFVLGSLSAFGPLSMDLYLPSLPGIAVDLGTTEAFAQVTMTTCMIGLAVGQLLIGPVTDRFGRRRPLLIGVGVFAAASFACALSGDMGTLVAVRAIQGLAGGVGIVVSRAVVRDMCETEAAARVFALLTLVSGIAPVLAPVIGAQVLRVAPWQGTFVVLGMLGCLLLIASTLAVRESLPAGRRTSGGWTQTRLQFGIVLRDSHFVINCLIQALGSAALFCYISMIPFILLTGYGLNVQAFAAIFAANSLGLILAGYVAGKIIRRRGTRHTLNVGLVAGFLFSSALAVCSAFQAGLPVILVLLFVVVSSVALVMPTSTALALAEHRPQAGTAAGVLGLAQFGLGGLIGPLVSLWGTTELNMSIAMAVCSAAALALMLLQTTWKRKKLHQPEVTPPHKAAEFPASPGHRPA